MADTTLFRHQEYRKTQPVAPYRVLPLPPAQPAVGSAEFQQRMSAVAGACRAAGVRSVLLVHGTFVGDDLFELASLLDPWSPGAAEWLRTTNKQLIDRLLGDAGNFTTDYVRTLSNALNRDGGPPIAVRRFIWSGANNHMARAVAAVNLVDELATLSRDNGTKAGMAGARFERASSELATGVSCHSAPGTRQSSSLANGRILCLGHSHGANALALVTHLLAADAEGRRPFLDIVRSAVPLPRRPTPRSLDWQRACERLAADRDVAELLGGRRLDIVTLGLPIRYSWHPAAHDGLLHFVNHRPGKHRSGVPRAEYRTGLPGSLDELLDGRDGDYVQQLGIAGSNFAPLPIRWKLWRAELRAERLISAGYGWRGFVRRLRLGMRVPDAGQTLLIDYGLPKRRHRLRHLLGHGVYTEAAWMLFHFEQIANAFYGLTEPAAVSGCLGLSDCEAPVVNSRGIANALPQTPA